MNKLNNLIKIFYYNIRDQFNSLSAFDHANTSQNRAKFSAKDVLTNPLSALL